MKGSEYRRDLATKTEKAVQVARTKDAQKNTNHPSDQSTGRHAAK